MFTRLISGRLVTFLVAVLMVGTAFGGLIFPSTKFETVDGITWMYVVNNGEATIGQGNMEPAIPVSTTGSVTVPATIGGYHVTAVQNHAFYKCPYITSLSFPDSVKSIGYLTCGDCVALETVRLPSGLAATPDSLFMGCTSLKSVEIPEGVTSFGRDAFWGCTSLTNAVIPSTLATLPVMTFYRCTSLEHVQLPTNLTKIATSAFSWCTALKSVEIPDSVTEIGSGAFEKCESLTELVLPAGLKRLECCLDRCTGLRSLKLPKGLETIAEGALAGLTGLSGIEIDADNSRFRSLNGALCAGDELIFWPAGKSSAVIPDGIRALGSNLFANRTSLTAVALPEGLEEIGDYALYHTSVSSVALPSTLKKIGACAFLWTPLASVDVPAATESIGRMAFANSTSLASVTIRHPNVRLGDGVFSSDSALASVMFSGNVASVGSGVFYGCSRLPSPVVWNGALLGYTAAPSGSLDVASGITSIAGPVFGSQVTAVTLPDTVTSLAADAFAGCSSLSEVIVPQSVAELVDALGARVGTPSHLLVATLPRADPFASWDFGPDGYAAVSAETQKFPCAAAIRDEAVEVCVSLCWTESASAPALEGSASGGRRYDFRIDDKLSLALTDEEGDGHLAFVLACDEVYELDGIEASTNRWYAFRFVLSDGNFRITADGSALTSGKTDTFAFAPGSDPVRLGWAGVCGTSGRMGGLSVRRLGVPVGFGGLGTNIPTTWAKGYPSFAERFGEDFAAALLKPTGKTDASGRALCVWHDFVAGTDPTDSNNVFRAAIAFEDGKPIVTWHPAKSADGFNRVHAVYGKAVLADEWTDVTEEKDLTPWSFFKVGVRVCEP